MADVAMRVKDGRPFAGDHITKEGRVVVGDAEKMVDALGFMGYPVSVPWGRDTVRLEEVVPHG